jgi:hypothetical protein
MPVIRISSPWLATAMLSAERNQYRLCIFEIGQIETFVELRIHRSQSVAGFVALALVAKQSCEVYGGAQLEPA